MPVPKLTASGTANVMKAEEKNDSIDTIIRQAIGKEPFVSFPRTTDSPVQWIQLLHALDQNELQGWPLLSPVKVQLQKCDKCSREFCSTINYRRHMRVHHRLKKLDKDSKKNRDLLAAYWDKLSIEEAKKVVSFENVTLEEVRGSSILKSLTTLIRKQGFSSLPQYYLRAGSALLDIVESRPSSFPISSQELFSILDDSSEKTFLCGTAVSMQKYVFDGDAGKVGLEPKNLVACTSFLLEQKLLKAWLADKEAEALMCQKQLVEEEEAAQKRQAEVLERKRQKKLRQKEQKAREPLEDGTEIKENTGNTLEAASSAAASLDTFAIEAHNPDSCADLAPSPHATCHFPDINEGVDGDTQSGDGCDADQKIEPQTSQGHIRRRVMVARRQGLPKSQWAAVSNGLHAGSNSQTSKLSVSQKYGANRDQRAAPILNGTKVWSRKPKPETDRMISKTSLLEEPDKGKNHEVLIGSISITLGNCSQSEGNLVAPQRDCMVDNLAKLNTAQEKPSKPDSFQSGNNQLVVKLWRPVGQHGTKDPLPLLNGGAETDAVNGKEDQNMSGPVNFGFSSLAAKAFLAQRWKEAISSNHVKLVISPDSAPPEFQEVHHCEMEAEASQSPNVERRIILASAENRLLTISGVTKSKTKMKPQKGIKIKYVPKQKPAT